MDDKIFFLHDSDFEDDELILKLAKMVDEQDKLPQEIVEDRVNLVKIVYSVIKNSVNGNKVEVSYFLHKPVQSVGYVEVSGKKIVFCDPLMFASALKLSDGIEVYTKLDGTVHINFTFRGLTKIVRE